MLGIARGCWPVAPGDSFMTVIGRSGSASGSTQGFLNDREARVNWELRPVTRRLKVADTHTHTHTHTHTVTHRTARHEKLMEEEEERLNTERNE